jgi:hypothetical protein
MLGRRKSRRLRFQGLGKKYVRPYLKKQAEHGCACLSSQLCIGIGRKITVPGQPRQKSKTLSEK